MYLLKSWNVFAVDNGHFIVEILGRLNVILMVKAFLVNTNLLILHTNKQYIILTNDSIFIGQIRNVCNHTNTTEIVRNNSFIP